MTESVPGPVQSNDPDPSDPVEDRAVEEIIRAEADDELKAQDAAAMSQPTIMKQTFGKRLKNFIFNWWNNPRKRWLTLVIVGTVVIVPFVVPFTRYNILGFALKAPVLVTAIDSKTGDPVSGAHIDFGGVSAETDADGRAVLRVRVGSRVLRATKAYYTGSDHTVLVTLSPSSNKFTAKLMATGRKVDIKLVNKLTGQPLIGAEIAASGTDAKTNSNGQATLVVSSGADRQEATVTLNGYNTTKIDITADGSLSVNTFKITPAGKVYFLSGGNVVKTDLDGENRSVVLAVGSSNIQAVSAVKASSDWKYVAVLATQPSGSSAIYVIDTTNNDKLLTVDTSNAASSLIGWINDTLVYYISRHDVSMWQTGRVSLKSYDPTTGQTLLLAQSSGSGSGSSDFTEQTPVDPLILGSSILYGRTWNGGAAGTLSGRQTELDSISPSGQNPHVIKTFTPVDTTGTSITMALLQYGPNALYVSAPDGMFYDYNDGSIAQTASVNSTAFATGTSPSASMPPTYYVAPSGNQTLWEDTGNESGVVFVGDGSGKNAKQVEGTNGYIPYGWYTDNYLLIAKHSELYVVSVNGGVPQQISAYDVTSG